MGRKRRGNIAGKEMEGSLENRTLRNSKSLVVEVRFQAPGVVLVRPFVMLVVQLNGAQ